jgi:hypothetical protein
MRWSYSCPHCRATLNREETIMLNATCGSNRIMIGFHPMPGNYEISLPPGFEIEPGSRWSFSCPSCRKSLESEVSPDLCALDMVTKNTRHRVYFSPVAGEHATFVISAEGIERFGEHADRHSLEILELI